MLPIIRGIVFVRPCDAQRRVVELEYRSEGVAANVQLEADASEHVFSDR